MDKSNQKVRKLDLTTLKTESGFELFSFNTVLLENWFVKASISNADTICVLMMNIESEELVVGFFTDEVKANDFVNFWTQF